MLCSQEGPHCRGWRGRAEARPGSSLPPSVPQGRPICPPVGTHVASSEGVGSSGSSKRKLGADEGRFQLIFRNRGTRGRQEGPCSSALPPCGQRAGGWAGLETRAQPLLRLPHGHCRAADDLTAQPVGRRFPHQHPAAPRGSRSLKETVAAQRATFGHQEGPSSRRVEESLSGGIRWRRSRWCPQNVAWPTTGPRALSSWSSLEV